jgi:molecular chaperone DnaK (HSP70)
LQWFKLLLSADAQRNAGEKVQEAQRILNCLNKLPVDVVADYLGCLWTHALTILEEKRLSRAILDSLVFKVVITVPAAWDHHAQDLMHEAATRAGIRASRAIGPTSVQLIAEPEAAALAAFSDAGLQWQPGLEVLLPHMVRNGQV